MNIFSIGILGMNEGPQPEVIKQTLFIKPNEEQLNAMDDLYEQMVQRVKGK